jgi:hypothetical protein
MKCSKVLEQDRLEEEALAVKEDNLLTEEDVINANNTGC